MPDYYQQFSFAINDLTEAERTWIKKVGEPICLGIDDADKDWERLQFLRDELAVPKTEEFDEDFWPGFEISFYDKENYAHLYCWEYFNADHLQLFLQSFLRKFRPTEVWGIEYANTCSRPVLDGFGGGWMIVSKDRVFWGTTAQAVSEGIEKMKRDQ